MEQKKDIFTTESTEDTEKRGNFFFRFSVPSVLSVVNISFKTLAAGVLFVPAVAGALEMEPWLGNIMEFRLSSAYVYSRYTQVQNGHPQFKHPSNDQLLAFDLALDPTPSFSMEVEMEFVNTPRQSWGYRSAAGQARILWWDEMMGDPLNGISGLSIREVSSHSLQDVSCPYHSHFNLELNSAIGKEWGDCNTWLMRSFVYTGIGMANRGAPWLRFHAAVQGVKDAVHEVQLFVGGYFGFGGRQEVKTKHFDGYADINHQSVDLGIGYTHFFDIWGKLDFSYTRRVYAHSFPERVNFYLIRYTLPFSL